MKRCEARLVRVGERNGQPTYRIEPAEAPPLPATFPVVRDDEVLVAVYRLSPDGRLLQTFVLIDPRESLLVQKGAVNGAINSALAEDRPKPGAGMEATI